MQTPIDSDRAASGATSISGGRGALLVWQREVYAGRVGLIVWALALSLLVIFYLWVFRALIVPQSAALQGFMRSLPPQLLAVANFSALGFASATRFFGSEPYTLISLFSSIYLAQLAGGILAKEETDGTAEFLLAKPIGRGMVLLGKAGAVLFYAVVLNAALAASLLLAFKWFAASYDAWVLLRLALALLMLHLAFVGPALWASACSHRVRSAGSIALGMVIAAFFIKMVASVSSRLDQLGDVSPFTHADSVPVILHGGPTGVHVAVLIAYCIAGLALAWWQYRRKDIHV